MEELKLNITTAKTERFVLSDFIINDLLPKTDSEQYRLFLKEHNYKCSGSKTDRIYNMKVALDEMDDDAFNAAMCEVESFFLDQVKYTSNRIILSYPFEMSVSGPLSSVNKFENHFNKSVDELNFSKLFDNSTKINHEFKKIHQNIIVDDDKFSKIEQIYVRRVKYSEVKKKCEFIWIEIDCVAREVRIHLENNAKNFSVRLQGRPNSIYKYFSDKINKEFLINALPNPQETTLFKLYRKLTSYAEHEYLQRVVSLKENFEEFTKQMIDTLQLTVSNDVEDTTNRVMWVFVRELIQNDFNNFLKIQQQGEGRVKSILFHYDEGGTINANSGSSNEDNLEELDLERQSAYFDTRESIYASKKLFSITIYWSIESEENKKNVLTRYRAYNQFLMTHFLKENVSKGVYDDVFPRIKEFESLTL